MIFLRTSRASRLDLETLFRILRGRAERPVSCEDDGSEEDEKTHGKWEDDSEEDEKAHGKWEDESEVDEKAHDKWEDESEEDEKETETEDPSMERSAPVHQLNISW